jgi:hypothetical protein
MAQSLLFKYLSSSLKNLGRTDPSLLPHVERGVAKYSNSVVVDKIHKHRESTLLRLALEKISNYSAIAVILEQPH